MKYSPFQAGKFSRGHEPLISFESQLSRDSKAVSPPPHSRTSRRCEWFTNVAILLGIMAVSAPLYASDITLQDDRVSVSFDSDSGALTRFEDKSAHWVIERRPEFGVSFRLFAPLPTRRYNPVFGQKQHAAEVTKVFDNEIRVRWENLV